MGRAVGRGIRWLDLEKAWALGLETLGASGLDRISIFNPVVLLLPCLDKCRQHVKSVTLGRVQAVPPLLWVRVG
jgi:hypothetical protein